MTAMTPQEENTYFLRQAAISSCGAAFVARHYGMNGSPSIRLNTSDNLSEEKLWLGSMQYEGWNTTPLRVRRITMAGFLADAIDCEEPDEQWCAESLAGSLWESLGDEFEDSDGWSRSKWDTLHGCKFSDVHAVYMILKRNWIALVEEAEFLMENAAESGGSSTTAWMRSEGLSSYIDKAPSSHSRPILPLQVGLSALKHPWGQPTL